MENISRRGLLMGGLAAAAGLADVAAGGQPIGPGNGHGNGTPSLRHAKGDKSTWDVIVVGAGAAGIGAARRLTDQHPDLRVVIVEARDRIGGRMHTDRTSMGIPVERGCELVHGGPYASTYPWIERAGFDMRMFQNNYIRQADAPRSSPSSQWHQWDSPTSWLFPLGLPEALIPYDPAGQNLPLPAALPGEMADAYLLRLGVTAANTPTGLTYELTDDSDPLYDTAASRVAAPLRDCIRYTLHPEQAPEPEILDPNDSRYDDGDYKIVGGYDQLLHFIAGDVPVMLRTVVEEVSYTANGVELLTSAGAMFGRRVVFAVPAGVMQRRDIAFTPGLPAAKWAAFDAFEYHDIFKCVLEFKEKVFTPNGTDNWGYAESMDHFPTTLWNASIASPGYKGQAIVGWETGAAARELHALPLEQKYQAVLEVVRKSAGDPGLRYHKAVMTDWANEPYSWGPYGSGGNSRDMAATVGGVLYWAGMRTSTVSASYSSGVAQADQLLLAL
ncbi:monoamine oxidase [Agromyces hippuratus]|uniref:Monoamine oxidase n=1 Tax=Agromyces hippuratus TaxID=286438 RepID=A0A852WYE1_9MICO|nr:NAD(P)/FAD-dependent oxidoreductase [Agromyces hippuratus]NYG22578.1 monoamine oxidase [Agromyces hippuratus]